MTASSSPARAPFTVKGWHVAAGVVAFFVVVIGVDGAFLTLAYRTHPGQVAARPYEAGLIYNAELERQRAQEALGWRAAVEARPDGVVALLQDRDGKPLSGLRVTATLLRPATEQGRTTVTLVETGPGQYAGTQRGLSGAWDARVEAVGDGPSFVAERRLTWP
jgi:nitrogen fixation protein FixH